MVDAETVARRLEGWFAKCGRRFPWRKIKDPYKIMVMEFLLQRTRAETIERMYNEIFQRFPDIETLAITEMKVIEDIFSRLGLLYRAVRLVKVARVVLENHHGHVPCDAESLLRLDGVGVYIASAVLNFGCDAPIPVVDKNVMRVANRLWGVKRESDARKLIEELYKYSDHKIIAYALIDLGSIVCCDEPRHGICPLNDICPKLPLLKEEWRMLRKVITVREKVLLREQPVTKISKEKTDHEESCLPK